MSNRVSTAFFYPSIAAEQKAEITNRYVQLHESVAPTIAEYGFAAAVPTLSLAAAEMKNFSGLTSHGTGLYFFCSFANQATSQNIVRPNDKTRVLRAKLQYEETYELTNEGLGVTTKLSKAALQRMIDTGNTAIDLKHDLEYEARNHFNMAEVLDGCYDCRVIATGTMVACGIPDTEMGQFLVDYNNVLKFRTDKDGYNREDGKWVKPSDHPEPMLRQYLEYHGWNKEETDLTEE